jgi:conjugal transfer mating pair stabilization protein TraN
MIARRVLSGLCAMLLVTQPIAAQQMTVEQAREEGKEMAQEKRNDSSLVHSSDAQAASVPGYTGTNQPQSTYYDDPDKLVADSQAMKSTNEQYQVTTDSANVRPTFSNAEILATTTRATAVENDPSTYLEGEAIGSSSGSCTPLPPGAGTAGYYEATCNVGAKVDTTTGACSVGLSHSVRQSYTYTCGTAKLTHEVTSCVRYQGRTCVQYSTAVTVTSSLDSCTGYAAAPSCSMTNEALADNHRRYVVGRDANYYSTTSTRTYSCSSETASPAGGSARFGSWNRTAAPGTLIGVENVYAGSVKDETACSAWAGNSNCSVTEEVCTSSDPETRVVNGVAITQPCWAWDRTYTCNTVGTGNDCGTLSANPKCSYVRDECLDDPDEAGPGPCKTLTKVYKCETPAGTSADTKQYICGNDVYCINGDCEPIVREASTEFKDALVGLHALDQAGKEFNETDLRVFSGTRETCHKPVFGLINCCAGKVSGAVPVAAGAAALAGGPAAIAAFATPFLVLFACSQDEMKLDIKDRMGFCHNVGTYCSSSFLGICSTKRTAYCCFESKLSRILQEQGRVQLRKPWASPKKEQCQGFTIEEFASLDLSVMDFTEVYSDFMDAAKLPDEVQTMSDIQDKIQAYYDLHGK